MSTNMAQNRGKQFEVKLQEDIKKSFDGQCFLMRIPDQMNGYKSASKNLCDFILFIKGQLFLIEAKTILGNTFPITNFTQFDKLMSIPDVRGVHRGVVIWFQDHSRVVYVPLLTIAKMKADGKKSVNIKKIDEEGYAYVNIPSTPKRVFLDSDYSVLLNLPEQGW